MTGGGEDAPSPGGQARADDPRELMPGWLEARMPRRYATEGLADPVAQARLYDTATGRCYYLIEYDPFCGVAVGLIKPGPGEGGPAELGTVWVRWMQEEEPEVLRDTEWVPDSISRVSPSWAERIRIPDYPSPGR